MTACPLGDRLTVLIVLTTMKRHWRNLGRGAGRGFVHASRYISLYPHAPRGNLTSHFHAFRGFFFLPFPIFVLCLIWRECLHFAVAESYRFSIKHLLEKG